ncbi:DMT family transporter [Microbacterium dauci]|uniref:DMT family transporter n=1 Tax=Microbacterium dauci TaxID=3048008 RepID=A0ABT6ZA96_9MICO|nr:DMT family transporter [Microbacterium sp. LX3-4]MDJ1113082.1 DMT family transporter [Microbacterium sp. LX3-4]
MAERSAGPPLWLALTGSVFVGVLTAVQARINGQLGLRLEHPMTAAVISFGSGLLLVALVSLALPSGRRGLSALGAGVRARSIPWWMLAGGIAGALNVATQSVAVGIVGVSLFTVGLVAGQLGGGLVLDRAGYGPGGVVPVTLPRVVGAALAVLAAGIMLSNTDGLGDVPVVVLILPVLAGLGLAWQQATNGRLRAHVGSAVTATFVNFFGGTAALLIGAVVAVVLIGPPSAFPSDPWLYLGGAIGVGYIMLTAALVVHTGVLLFGLSAVSGQLVASLIMDAAWPAPRSPGILVEVVTVAVALVAVVIAGVWRVRR